MPNYGTNVPCLRAHLCSLRRKYTEPTLPIKASDMGISTRKSISTTLYFPSSSVLYRLYNR